MKHLTPNLGKFKKLQRRLKTDVKQTVGILELLWIATQTNAPRGDIGAKLDDEELAIACDWQGDPSEFVAVLVETEWLDKHAEHRLVVHDWADHAPYYIRGLAARMGGFVVAGSLKIDRSTSPTKETDVRAERTSATYVDNVREQQPHPTPPHSTPPHPTSNVGDVGNWREVEQELHVLKLSDVTAALQAARERSLSVADVRTLIGEWKAAQGAYGLGALHSRLTGKLATWPPASQEHQRQQQRDESTQRFEQQREKNATNKTEAATESADRKQLETEFGPMLQAMSRDEVQALLAVAFPDRDLLKLTGKNMRRVKLLEVLAERNGSAV